MLIEVRGGEDVDSVESDGEGTMDKVVRVSLLSLLLFSVFFLCECDTTVS